MSVRSSTSPGVAVAQAGTVELNAVGVVVGGRPLLEDVSLTVLDGEVLGLLGPNGSGKSTLLRTVYGVRLPDTGSVRTAGIEPGRRTARSLARRCAVLTQDHATDLELDVVEVVLLGRIPHGRSPGGREADLRLARQCLARVDADHLADRRFPSLSGGERQRVLLARALCQDPQVLVLDEPTNHLDVAHQLELLSLVRSLQVTCLVALHDLSLAAAYCDRVALLQAGRLVAVGTPEAVLTPARVEAIYGVACDVLTHPRTRRPLLAVSHLDAKTSADTTNHTRPAAPPPATRTTPALEELS